MINKDEAMKTALQRLEIFSGCTDSFFEAAATNAAILKEPKGKMLFLHEDKAERFYIMQRGWVKVFRETLDGAQAVIDILTTGHVFGESSLFHDNLYPYSCEVVEAGQIVSLPLSALKAEIESNPKMALQMMSSMARYRRRQDQEIEHRTLQNASQRIGCFLLRLTDQNQTGPVTIHLPYDKTLVASRLGMQPETFSRALAKLKNETGIKVKGATIEMEQLTQLTEYSCVACSSNFPCVDLKTMTG